MTTPQLWTVEHNGEHVPIQYDLRHKPWRLLIACALLRQTGGHVVKPVLDELFTRWPQPHELLTASVAEVTSIIAPGGLQNVKVRVMLNITVEYLLHIVKYHAEPRWHHIASWLGVGPYTIASYKIFVDRQWVAPTDTGDHVLEAWQSSMIGALYYSTGRIDTPK